MRAKRKGIKPRGSAKESATQRHTQPMSWQVAKMSREHCYTEEVETRLGLFTATVRDLSPGNVALHEYLDEQPTRFMNDLFSNRVAMRAED